MQPNILIINEHNWGLIPLPDADRQMSDWVRQRQADQIPDRLLFLRYPPCLAVGARQLNPADLLQPLADFERQGIPLFQTNRGGGLTYHWPGQLLVYPILKLRPCEQNIPRHMFRLEEVGLRTLKDFGVIATRQREHTAQIGLWHEGRKVASMGIFIARWVTSYGFALNLSGDLTPSRGIRPCGLEDVQLTSIEKIIRRTPDRLEVMQSVRRHFQEIFDRHLVTSPGSPNASTDINSLKEVGL